jgi:hypothetical protein
MKILAQIGLFGTALATPLLMIVSWIWLGAFAALTVLVGGVVLCIICARYLRKKAGVKPTIDTPVETKDFHSVLRKRLLKLALSEALQRSVVEWSPADSNVPYIQAAAEMGMTPPLLGYKRGELKLIFGPVEGQPEWFRVYCDIMQRSRRPDERRTIPDEYNPVLLWRPTACFKVAGVWCADFNMLDLEKELMDLMRLLESAAIRANSNFSFAA